MAHKIVHKSWGQEEWIVNEQYCGKRLTCRNVWSSEGKLHYHKQKDETFYILTGRLLLDVGQETMVLNEGDSMRIKPGTRHRFKSLGELCEFIEFSTHHDDKDTYYE